MSTNSNIVLHLRKEDTTKTFLTPWNEEVKPNGKEYLSTYCHWDGYPEGVGKDLVNKKMTYDDALKFILRGEYSTTDLSYWDWREEKCPPIPEKTPGYHQAYLYVLEETEPNKPLAVMIVDPEDDELETLDEYFERRKNEDE